MALQAHACSNNKSKCLMQASIHPSIHPASKEQVKSAPGIIIAHGTIGFKMDDNNPDLYISRDGGVSWAQTLIVVAMVSQWWIGLGQIFMDNILNNRQLFEEVE